MKYSLRFRMFTMFIVGMLGIFSYPANAQAKSSALVTTNLTIQTAETVQIGSSSPVIIKLTSTKGDPIPDQPIEFYVNGALERRSRTNAEGSVTLKLNQETVGTYSLVVIYKGSRSPTILASKATATVTVVPAKIEIHVTPPLPDIKFSLDNQIFSTNADGLASIEMGKTGKFHLELLTPKSEDENMKIEFSRWSDDTFVPYRDIEVPLEQPLDVGFEVSYQVSHTFIDLASQPVDPARITSVTVKGSNGTTYTFHDNLPHWLLAGRVVRLSNGLEQTKILYSVIDVTIDGSNVVSQAQQRFFAEPNDVWPLKLLLYSARFTARDALFRFPIGTGIEMEYPNGETKTFKFDASNEYQSEGLARGIYHVTVIGVRGIAPPTPIALSRDQDVELIVLSYIDIGFMLALGLFFAFGLLFFGRPKILAYLAAIPGRMIALPRQWVTVNLPPLFNKLKLLLNARVLKQQTTLPETNRGLLEAPQPVSENIQIEPESQYLIEEEIPPIPDATKMQPVEVVLESGIANTPSEVQQNEIQEVSPRSDELGDEILQPTSNAESLEFSEPYPIDSTNISSQPTVSEVKLTSLIHEIKAPVQTKLVYACRVCGGVQMVKDGTNRRGTQHYVCDICGTYNIFEAKRTSKNRPRKKVAN